MPGAHFCVSTEPLRFKGELLSTNTDIEHQAALGLRKHGNPLVESRRYDQKGGEAAVYRFPDRPPNRRNRTCLRADNPLRWPVPDTAGPRFPRYSSPQDRVLWPWHLREPLPGRVADRAR